MASKMRMPPISGLMPQPCPATSPPQTKRTGRVRASGPDGAGRRRPSHQSLRTPLRASSNATRTRRAGPGGSGRSRRAVKSLAAVASGPRRRSARRKPSSSPSSTHSREARSARAQTVARPAPTSPNCRPCASFGRADSAPISAGAASAGRALPSAPRLRAPPERSRKRRREASWSCMAMARRGGIDRLAFAHGSDVAAVRDGGGAFAAVAWCARDSLWQLVLVGGTSVPMLFGRIAAN